MLTIWPMDSRLTNRGPDMWKPVLLLRLLPILLQVPRICMWAVNRDFMYPLRLMGVRGLPMAATIRQKLKCIIMADRAKEQIRTTTPVQATWYVKEFIPAAEAVTMHGREPLVFIFDWEKYNSTMLKH